VVEGGLSMHAVQEVFSDCYRRISIQGWFHCDGGVLGAQHATIAQLTRQDDEIG
jgi:Rps23 Pro-64 3,4-dihydroxylase Tpa1-like proline 4-hydroxylase